MCRDCVKEELPDRVSIWSMQYLGVLLIKQQNKDGRQQSPIQGRNREPNPCVWISTTC